MKYLRRRGWVLFLFSSILLTAGEWDEEIARYALPCDHPVREELDRIFISNKTLRSVERLKKAGCSVLQLRDPCLAIVALPDFPDYLLKVHLYSSELSFVQRWENILSRCRNAEALRQLIRRERLQYFVVPDKWIYVTLFGDPVLVVTRMPIVSEKTAKYIWKNRVKKEQLRELFCIVRNGCGSSKLAQNMPYIGGDVFACIDTEKPPFGDRYIKKYLSKEMQNYWDYLAEGK